MLYKGSEVLLVGSNKNGYVEIGIFLRPQSKVISFSQDFNSMRNVSYSSHQLLICSTGCSPASNFSIKASCNNETYAQLQTSLFVSPRHRPSHIAGCVSNCLSNWISSFFFFIEEGLGHKVIEFFNFFWRKKIPSDKLCNGETDSVLSLGSGS